MGESQKYLESLISVVALGLEKDSHLLLKKLIKRDIISGKIGILGKGFGPG